MVQPRSYLVLNVSLLFIASLAGYVWFVAHAKPHMATFLFGSVSLLALGGVAVALGKTLFGGKEAENKIREWMKRLSATSVLCCALVVIAIAFAVTGTIYFESKRKDEIALRVSREGGREEPVAIDDKNPNPAKTYFALFKPIKLTIVTDTPHGYNPHPSYILPRAWPATLKVPEPALRKKFFLVRLLPANHFFSLRGRTTPDMRYRLNITVPNDKTYHVDGLMFRAILLGASDTDLIDQAKETRNKDSMARNYVKGARDADKIVADWLDDPLRIATRELKLGESVTVELTPTKGSPRINIPVKGELNEQFLIGAPK
jgi:hypothetical protein